MSVSAKLTVRYRAYFCKLLAVGHVWSSVRDHNHPVPSVDNSGIANSGIASGERGIAPLFKAEVGPFIGQSSATRMIALIGPKVPRISIPSKKQLENYIHYKKKTQGATSNDVGDCERHINTLQYNTDLPGSKGFVFGGNFANGVFSLGDGDNSDHVIINMTSKSLLTKYKNAMDAGPVMLHIDSTFKVCSNHYLVVPVGYSDHQHKFHLLSASIISHSTEMDYSTILSDLKTALCFIARARDLNPTFVMSDGEGAIINFTTSSFPQHINLMCYFHIMKNVKSKLDTFGTGLSGEEKRYFIDFVRDLHSSRSEEEFASILEITTTSHRGILHQEFLQYLRTTWIDSNKSKWRVFDRLPSFASTNNPLEQYNAVLKSVYTQRKRLPMIPLINELCNAIFFESVHEKEYSLYPRASIKVMASGNSLSNDSEYTITCVGNIVTISSNNNVPITTYVIDCSHGNATRCQCHAFYDRGYCKHVVAALKMKKISTDVVPLNRTFTSRGRAGRPRGRPASVGPALSYN